VPLRVTFHERDEAEELVSVLTTAGFDAGVTRERFAGEDDGQEVVFVVHTDAGADDVDDLLGDTDAWVEESSPLVDASEPTDLPTEPHRPDV
jgi:hypothetical protein